MVEIYARYSQKINQNSYFSPKRNLVQRDRFARSVDPLCILYVKSRGSPQWKEIGRTERLHNTLSPEWSQTMVLDYYFEEKQVSI